jgi:hypothetical protein
MDRWLRIPMSLNEQAWCQGADTCKACSEGRQGECRKAAEQDLKETMERNSKNDRPTFIFYSPK